MGDDLRVANAARVSFNKESNWEEILGDYHQEVDIDSRTIVEWRDKIYKLSNQDERLIHYLAKHGHWTPFSHCMVTLRERVPIFIARQRFKHMVGFTYNEVSRRYVDSPPEFYSPNVWRKRAEDKKQGSSEEEVSGQLNKFMRYHAFIEQAEELYRIMLDEGVAPEQARMVLPQSMYTEFYSTGSLAAWARAYKLRSEETSQKEIQELAEQWNKIIEPLFPVSWKALTQ